MSVPPKPPDRLEAKTSVRPSPDRLGCCSAAGEFSGAPRFTGVDQGSCTLRRGDVHRSAPPPPPARGEKKKRSEEHTSEIQSLAYLVCRLLLLKKKKKT